MKRFFILISILSVASIGSASAMKDIPDTTFLYNKYLELMTVGEWVVGLSENGITLLQWDPGTNTLVRHKHYVFNTSSKSMKLRGTILIVRHENDDLSFFDSQSFPLVEKLGTVTPNVDYFDFAFVGGEIYLSRWFDGIDRYRLQNFNSLVFLENEISAVAATQLESDSVNLFALDLYNGVLKYDLRLGFGNNINKILVNQRPFAFSLLQNLVFISKNSEGAYFGIFHDSGNQLLTEITGVPSPNKVLRADIGFALVSERELNVFDADPELFRTYTFDSNRWQGDTIKINNEHKLLLPGKENGVTLFDLIDQVQQDEVLSYPGKINSAIVDDCRIFTGGGGNPLEVYEIEGDSLLSPLQLREAETGVADLSISSSFLLALYGSEQRVFVFDISNVNDVTDATDTLPVSIADASELNTYEQPEKSVQLVTVENKNQIELFTGALGSFEPATVWTFDKPIADAKIVNGRLFVTDRFETITAYSIESDFSLSKCAERNLTGTGWAMAGHNNQLFVFTGNTLSVFDDCLVLDTIVRMSAYVLDAEIENDTLYEVGPDGIAKYDLHSGLPVLADKGGLKGSQISVDNGTIATTDGSSINIYFGETSESGGENNVAKVDGIRLYENYPEPFNSATTIQFELPSNSQVELSVYNLLGQRVRVLKDNYLNAGRHSISWDGKNGLGLDVASGIYFYKLQVGEETISKKMLLIK